MLAVLDTNILVSALLSRSGTPAKVLSLVFAGKLAPCFDWRIFEEYSEVLSRPKFSFPSDDVNALLVRLLVLGRFVLAEPLSDVFIDESDKKFYEVALACGAMLITGNTRHFPSDPLVVSPSDFLKQHGGI